MNYYQILEIDINVEENLIKKSFRTLSKKFHPDKGGDEEKYKKITEAYNVLGNPAKKKEYDSLLFTTNLKSIIILSDDDDQQEQGMSAFDDNDIADDNDDDKNNSEENYFRKRKNSINSLPKKDPFENIINKFMYDNRNYLNLDENNQRDEQINQRDEQINILLKKMYNGSHLNDEILNIMSKNFPYDISHITDLWKNVIKEKDKKVKEENKIYKISTPLSNLITKSKKNIVINYSKKCTKCLGIFKLYKCRACLTTYKKQMKRCLECNTNLKPIYCKNCKETGKINQKITLNIFLYEMEIIPENYRNIVIKIIPKNSTNFSIINDIDIKTQHEISFYDCMYGTNIKVKYFCKKVLVVKIPPKVPVHIPFIVTNYGILNKTGTKRGNLLIELVIKYPTNITKKTL